MNQVNPIHIAILFIVILAFLMTKLSGAKDELQSVNKEHKETLYIAEDLKKLDTLYSDKNAVLKTVNRVLKQSSFKSANIKQKVSKNSITISSDNISKVALNSLMGKLLNGVFHISKFKIKKIDDKKATLLLEIKW